MGVGYPHEQTICQTPSSNLPDGKTTGQSANVASMANVGGIKAADPPCTIGNLQTTVSLIHNVSTAYYFP